MDNHFTISVSKRGAKIMMVIAIVMAVLTPVAVVAAGGTFTDDDTSVFEADIEWMASTGITFGCNPPDNDNYCPTKAVNRGQMAAFMHRLAANQVVDAATAITADSAAAADDSDMLDGLDSTDFLGATDQAVDSDMVDGLGADDLAPSFLTAKEDAGGLDLSTDTDICATADFTPTQDMTALILTETTFQAPVAGLIQWGTKAAYSTDGGTTWTRATPDWWLRVTSDAGQYNGVTSNGVVELDAGTTYQFGHSVRRFSGETTTAEYICKTIVQLMPRTTATGIQSAPVAELQGSQLP